MAYKSLKQKDVVKNFKAIKRVSKKSAEPLLRAVGDEAFGFMVREIRELPDIDGKMWRMEFVKNGADLVWIETDDRSKTFAVTFRTLPEDDTGVAHIVEHSVLCGSKKFPVKRPYVELHRSSVGSCNAYTCPDHTCYHVSSHNDEDLLNLAEVYLDAVFAPLSIKNNWAMPQERNIVFNEMKGYLSSPDEIACCEMSKQMFPTNAYGRNHGGAPAAIPTLTMGKYCEFYERFYHPSNSRVFLCGNVDLMPMLKLISSYLGRYERRDVPPLPSFQLPVASEKVIEYACDTVADRTRVCEGWVFGTWRDVEKNVALDVVCDILAGYNEAPLTRALLDAGVCDDFYMTSCSGYQNKIMATFVNVHDGMIDEARRIFRGTLERLVREGFDSRQIAAKLDNREFHKRERASLNNGVDALSAALRNWLYGGDPAERIEFSKRYESLRRLNGTGCYERLVRETILENPHHATLIMKPTATPQTEAEILPHPAPEAPDDDPADIAKIPRLHLADIPEKGEFTKWTVDAVDGVEVVRPLVKQDGITYVDLAFDVSDLTDVELLDLPLLGVVLGNVPAGGRDVPTLRREISSKLGHFSSYAISLENGACFSVHERFLAAHAEDALCLLKDILFSSDFSQAKAIADIRNQRGIALKDNTLSSGDYIAGKRAGRGLSLSDWADELLNGLTQCRHLTVGRCGDLAKLAEKVFARGRLIASVANPLAEDFVRQLIQIMPVGGPIGHGIASPSFCPGTGLSDCFVTKGQGAFTAMRTRLPKGVACSGAFEVAAEILSLGYLWDEIRVKGGAYGGGFSVDHFGKLSFTSWSDPRPFDTIGVFEKCGAALRKYVKSGQSIEKYKVSLGGKMDVAYCVGVESLIAFVRHLSGITVDDLQRVRSEILHTTADDLLRFADILDQVLPTATRCVIGEEALVRRCGLPEFKI